ncbi:hypothetical protein HYX12_04040 [Candidatus Woesearchaeota archaeon]|nr:hypothetical protein [Candidatus Woesearchaeota archaeon]
MPRKKVKHLVPIYPENVPMRIKFKDIFDLPMFYKTYREWFLEYDWKDEEGDGDHWESYYGERIDQKGMREIWFLWRLTKDPPHSKYIKYYMDIDVHCVAITDTEIIKDGKKLKSNKGEIEMKIWAYVQEKFQDEFEKHSLLKQVSHLFAHRIYDKEVYQRRKELHQEMYVMQNFIKQWFKLKTNLPYEESKQFWRSFAWPSHLKE